MDENREKKLEIAIREIIKECYLQRNVIKKDCFKIYRIAFDALMDYNKK